MTYQKITIPLDHGNRNMKTVDSDEYRRTDKCQE